MGRACRAGACFLSAALLLPPGAGAEEALAVSGRVFARLTADQRRQFEREMSVTSARVGLAAKLGFAEAKVSADLSSPAPLKDAFVRLHDQEGRLRVQGGQFKAPFLARRMLSAWELPLVSRGLLDDYLVERHQLSGRRLGLMVELNPPGPAGVSAAVLQGPRNELGRREGEDAAARLELKLAKRVVLGAGVYLSRLSDPKGARAGGVDLSLRRGGFTLAAEAVAGRLPLGPFAGGLLLLTHRLAVLPGESFRLEPLIGAESLALFGPLPGRGWAATAGANAVWAERVRVQLQAERALMAGDPMPQDRLLFQLGATF